MLRTPLPPGVVVAWMEKTRVVRCRSLTVGSTVCPRKLILDGRARDKCLVDCRRSHETSGVPKPEDATVHHWLNNASVRTSRDWIFRGIPPLRRRVDVPLF